MCLPLLYTESPGSIYVQNITPGDLCSWIIDLRLSSSLSFDFKITSSDYMALTIIGYLPNNSSQETRQDYSLLPNIELNFNIPGDYFNISICGKPKS